MVKSNKYWGDGDRLTYVTNNNLIVFDYDMANLHVLMPADPTYLPFFDLANPATNNGKKGFTTEEREGFGNILSAGFIDTFRLFNKNDKQYTWWSHFANSRARNIGWRIDYLLTSKTLKPAIKNAKIHSQILGSDHCPVSITIDLNL